MALLKETNEIMYKIIGSCMEVHRILGPGLEVDIYRKALEVEMAEKELSFESQKSLEVMYKEVIVGTQEIDFLVNEGVVVAIKSQPELMNIEVQQVLRCLSLAECSIGLLVNFSKEKADYRRIEI